MMLIMKLKSITINKNNHILVAEPVTSNIEIQSLFQLHEVHLFNETGIGWLKT